MKKPVKKLKPKGRKVKSPTNNRLAQGVSNSAWPMQPSNVRKTRGASPFSGTSGASY